jgi:hypothetical protein
MLPKFPPLRAPGDEDLLQNVVMIHFAEDGSARNISTHVHDTMKEAGFLAAFVQPCNCNQPSEYANNVYREVYVCTWTIGATGANTPKIVRVL